MTPIERLDVYCPRAVDALYVDTRGPYPALLGYDRCWGATRDARTYTGGGPVIAHPPCARWGPLANVNAARWGTPIGSDGGLFAHALSVVCRVGGVLEHPAGSMAFAAFGIPRPGPLGTGWLQTSARSWVCEVRQAAYGHLATKRTWLLYVGDRPPPDLDWSPVNGTHTIGGGRQHRAPTQTAGAGQARSPYTAAFR